MSSETAISAIATVKKKLDKYLVSKQNNKVDEYLEKLHHTSITPTLLRETQIDVLVSRLATDNKASYCSTAKSLLKKWHDKNLLSNSSNTSKVKTITNTNKAVAEKKLALKRKSNDDDDDTTHSNPLSESQSSDDYKNSDRDRSSSSSVKKRKVLSIAEYVGNKKPTPASSSITTTTTAPSSIATSTQNALTDTQIQEIYAQFNAKCEELAATAPTLANNVDKILTQNSNRNDIIANGHHPQTTTTKPNPVKHKDFWDDDDDDDDDDNDSGNGNNHCKQATTQPSKSIPNQQIVNNNSVNTQQVKKPTPSVPTTKLESRSVIAAIASSIASLDHSHVPSRSASSQSTNPTKKSGAFNFLRPKQERQAIYSGKRAARTSVPSLQDLCVEVLKDNVEDASHIHLNRLPYDIVKPIIESATPDQLNQIIDHNPDYVDDVEPLWQKFCSLQYKEAEPDESESYYELYWRKFNENEERLQRITEYAKKKKAETVETGRQTKSLVIRQTANRHVPASRSTRVTAPVVGLPPSKPARGQTKVKKPTMPPLLKKTLRAFNGKS